MRPHGRGFLLKNLNIMHNAKKHDLPAMPFYFGDWMKAPEIRALPLDTRMVWFEMMGFMWESTERGYLTINGSPIKTDSLARMIGISEVLLEQKLKQLLDFAVYSVRDSDGAIYSRRMVRDEEIRKIRQKAGSVGGKVRFASSFAQAKTQAITEYENEYESEDENEIKDTTVSKIDVESIKDYWNAFAASNGLSQIIKLSEKRKSGIIARHKDADFDIDKIIHEIGLSDFLRGSTGWKVDFDFIFCSPNNYLKIMEGKYRNGIATNGTRKSGSTERATFRHTEQQIKDNLDFAESLRINMRQGD